MDKLSPVFRAILVLSVQDARRIRVSFGGNEESERAMKMLQQLAFPGIEVPEGTCYGVTHLKL